jgi:2-oxoglutarate ferredoxin oxidoreductase subunit beta
VLNGLKLEVVTIGENGVSEDDILVHDAKCEDTTLQQMLVKLEYPLVTGIIRSYEDELFEEREARLTEDVRKNSKFSSVDELFLSGETYEVK